jgi:hypothetical protein
MLENNIKTIFYILIKTILKRYKSKKNAKLEQIFPDQVFCFKIKKNKKIGLTYSG